VPEGHTLHRLARRLDAHLVGSPVAVSSPQGRFAREAALLDGSRLLAAEAWGKHLFLDHDDDRVVHVHLGLYGRFDVTRTPGEGVPAPVGQVRMRLVAEDGPKGPAYADLRGATACELLTSAERAAILARLGPDPIQGHDPTPAWERIRVSRSPIGTLLMDQSVLAGVGNVYRAEILFRHGVHPLRLGRSLRRPVFLAMWEDLRVLMADGVRTGRIETVRDEHREELEALGAAAGRRRRSRSYVYKRTGEPCVVCGATVRGDVLAARNVFWCPHCQPAPRRRAVR